MKNDETSDNKKYIASPAYLYMKACSRQMSILKYTVILTTKQGRNPFSTVNNSATTGY